MKRTGLKNIKRKYGKIKLRRNCKKCSKWRPISDYRTIVKFSKREARYKEYLNGTCDYCRNNRSRERSRKLRGYPSMLLYNPGPIIEIAESFGWNNKQIACGADVDVKTVYRWKKMGKKISSGAVDNLCIALGTSLEIVYPYE